MAWNEPGGNKNRDPWNNGSNGNKGGGNGGPPDLDDLLKDLGKKFNGLFGGGGKGDSNNAGGGIPLFLIALVGLVVWGLSGFYTVDQSGRAVVLEFGKFKKIAMPGLNWHPRFIQSYEKVNTQTNREIFDDSRMLTEDENIVHVKFGVQYTVKSATDFIFNLKNPDQVSVLQASQSAIRQIIGKNKFEYVTTTGRDDIADKSGEQLQKILDSYNSGITVNQFNLTYAEAPEQVRDAFNDAIKAREDKERFINEAQAYSNEIIPLARGQATRQVEEAKAYQVSVVKRSEGEADRFNKLLVEYSKAPEVTRERLYLDAVESVLTNSTKVMVDVDGGNNMMYLPLDKIMSQQNNTNSSRRDQDTQNSPASPARESLRTRESR